MLCLSLISALLPCYAGFYAQIEVLNVSNPQSRAVNGMGFDIIRSLRIQKILLDRKIGSSTAVRPRRRSWTLPTPELGSSIGDPKGLQVCKSKTFTHATVPGVALD